MRDRHIFNVGMTDPGGLLAQVDISAIPDTDDKLNECEYFLNLASSSLSALKNRSEKVTG
ncbi:hypothetical protein SAMN05720354_1035 [Nitrosospira sp. Nsp1]|nr:hypothetical protein SAMN05720354_1035 [Nitrosospira sp. Nsp1]